MQWSELKPVNPESAKTITVIGLLVVVVMLNLCTLHYDMYDKNSLLQIKTTDTKTLLQIKQINHGLRQVVEQLSQNRSLSEASLKSVASKLTEIQSAVNKLPTQDNFQQLQTAISQIHHQLTAKESIMQHAIQKKVKVRRSFRKHMYPHYLPFVVTGIDIWNGEPAVTIQLNGTPQLMTKNDERAGWILIDVSFERSVVIFQNARTPKQTCTVKLR
jgi:hypothetical protein